MATLTFAERAAPERARWCFHRWVRWLEQRAKRRIDWFVTAERSDSGAWPHLHVLVHGTSLLPTDVLEQAWKHGHVRIVRYDPKRAGTYYVTKGIGDDLAWHDVSATLTDRAPNASLSIDMARVIAAR